MKGSDFDLNNLDFQNPGTWPNPVKYFFAALIIVLLAVGGYYGLIKRKVQDLEALERTELELIAEFRTKQAKVVNLDEYRRQLDDMRELLRQMLRQLPSKTEMPDLLVDISQAALATGLDNQKFQPQPEVVHEFYAEKPISLRLVGGFHQFGEFMSAVASLPRVVILTMHDISLGPSSSTGQAPGQLVLEGTVKTYRYVDDDETALATGEAVDAGRQEGGTP
jgi:type IV pilus assembly protein PilO